MNVPGTSPFRSPVFGNSNYDCDELSCANVLVATRHSEFESAALQQLSGRDQRTLTLSVSDGFERRTLRGFAPEIAFVDLELKTDSGLSLFRLIASSCPDCSVVLICSADQTGKAAHFVRTFEVRDYVCTDAVQDNQRIPLLVEMFRTSRESPAQLLYTSNLECDLRPALDGKVDMRSVLWKYGGDSLVNLLDAYESPSFEDLVVEWLGGSIDPRASDCVFEWICNQFHRVVDNVTLASSKTRGSVGGLQVSGTFSLDAQSGNLVDRSNLKGKRILVVDDDEVSVELAKAVLEESGFIVNVARSPESARVAFDEQCPDLVLMDVHLGHANGVKLVARMRKGSVFPDVPVVMVTSDGTVETVADAASVKIQGYIVKPYDTNFFIEKICSVLRDSQPVGYKIRTNESQRQPHRN